MTSAYPWPPAPSIQDWAAAKQMTRKPEAQRALALGLACAREWRFRPTQTPTKEA